MTSGLSFLIAAKRCEIAELERLALTNVLVNAIGRLVHGLQRERGLSNLYLASQGARWAAEREDQIHQAEAIQTEVRACFDKLDTEAAPGIGHGARLYSRIAYVLQGLDALPRLQASIAAQQQLLHLIESQKRCSQVFGEFASPAVLASWRAARQPEALVCLERLRRVLCTTAAGAPLSSNLSQAWFDCCTTTMDAMKTVEEQMSSELLSLCEQRIASTSIELTAFEALNNRESIEHHPTNATAQAFFDTNAGAERLPGTPLSPLGQGFGQQLDRSIFELVQEQTHRLQSMSEELDTVRASLNERKLIERAKGLLMAHRSLSEDAAHKALRQMAMNQNKRVIDVAEAVLAVADVLPEPKHQRA